MDVSKFFATNKFEKRAKSRVCEITRSKKKTDTAYEDLVSEIRVLRLQKKSKQLEHALARLEKLKQDKKRYKNILRAMGGASDMIERYGIPLLDMLHSLIEALKNMRDAIGEDILKFLLDLFTTLYNIYKNPSWDGVVINATSFFVRNFDRNYADIAIEWFKQAFAIILPQSDEKPISYSDYILSLFDLSDKFLNDKLWDNISDFFSKIITLYAVAKNLISLEVIDFNTVCKKFKEFRQQIPKISDVIEMAFEAYKFVTGNWEKICSGDWSVMLLGKEESKVFELEIRELEQAYNFVLAGQEIELKNIYNTTPDAYEARLKKAIETAKSLIMRCTSNQQRMSISNFIKKLTEMQSNLWARKADAPTKAEAYAIKMSGPSSCGKSTMIKMLSKTILNAYGRDPNESGSVVFTNLDERYESTILPSHRIIVADDVANNKNSNPNYDRLLNYVNTVPRPLEKAGADDKGKYYPGNDALIATTNDQTIRATECSICPESILRRFTLDVEVSIREPFRNEFGGLIKQDNLRFDVYSLILKRFSHIDYSGKQPLVIWDIIPRREWNPFEDEDHDFHAMCSFVAKDIERHRKQQMSQSIMQKKLDECGFCGVCRCPDVICACTKLETQSGFSSYWQSFNTAQLWELRTFIMDINLSVGSKMRKSAVYYKIYRDRSFFINSLLFSWMFLYLGMIFNFRLFGFLSLVYTYGLYSRYCTICKSIDDEIQRRQDQLSSLCTDVTTHLEENAKKYFAISGGIFVAYGLYKVLKSLFNRKIQDKSTFIDRANDSFSKIMSYPTKGKFVYSIQDERDYKEGYSRLPPKENSKQRTTSSKDLHDSLARHLRVVYVKSKGQVLHTVNGIMVASNVLMVPSHIIPFTFPFDIETTTTPNVPSAKTKDQSITEDFCYIDRETDQAFIHLASSPASRNYSDFFCDTAPTFYGKSTVLLWKSPENEVKISRQAARPNATEVNYSGYIESPGFLWGQKQKHTTFTLKRGQALRYDTEFEGFSGLCGGLLVDREKAIIYGFHVAGLPNTCEGYSTIVLRSNIQKALEKLYKTSPTLVVHSANIVNVDTYGLPYTLENQKPLYLRDDGPKEKAVCSYLGTVHKEGQPIENRARTPYIPSPFKGIVDNLGECHHMPPTKPNSVEKGMKTLNKLLDPVQHYEGDILKLAIEDYKQHTLQMVYNDPEAKDMLRIYTQEEAMDGIGKFGLGGLPNDTSAGFPIQKSKKYCLERDPCDETLIAIPRKFNDRFDIQSEIDRTMDQWSKGLRSESIYKASSKVNELLPINKAKDKVRKFYGSSFANFVASRRVLAGIPQIMKKHWKTSECLVGINALSVEWDQFHSYLTEYSTTNMIAGDFAGFDTRMAAQITGAAAKIMVSWYEAVGCSEQDLTLIRGALSDIIHPNILFDGDLYRFANGNPSGNLITVQLNSICNSIMMRYVYYAQMPNIREKFADNIRLGTYGDDNAMSVKKHCSWYTHTSCQKEFEKLDISYTMADKDTESLPYIGIDKISFLKRRFMKHADLNIIVAPIEEDSILKRFHWIKKPTETPLSFVEQFAAYTDGAIRDYYLYGREAYDQFLCKLRNIVSLNEELQGAISFIPYDEMTQILKPDYSKDYVNKNEKLFADSCGLSEEELCE